MLAAVESPLKKKKQVLCCARENLPAQTLKNLKYSGDKSVDGEGTVPVVYPHSMNPPGSPAYCLYRLI